MATLALGCNQNQKPSVPPSLEPSPTPVTAARLSVASPTGRIAMDVPVRADSIVVQITSLANPARQAFVLRVSIEGSQEGQTIRALVGNVSPFPPDQPAAFALPVSERAANLIDSAEGHVVLVLELVAADAARPLEPPLDVVVEGRLPGG